MQRLLTLKQALQTLEDLNFAASDSEDEDEDDYEEDEESMTFDEIMADGENVWSVDHEDGLDSDELNDLLDDAKQSIDLAGSTPRLPPKKKRKTRREKDEGPKMVTPVFDLVEPEFVSSKSKTSSHRQEADNDLVDAYGEATTLHSVDAADKTARKKSLRFHTSKIDSATARRQGARNQAAGGDDDIPYRERKSAKEARLVKEAAIRAQNQVGAPLDDEEPEPRAGQKRSRGDEDDEGAESPDDYYELVKNKSKETKMRKKEEYEAASGRARYSRVLFGFFFLSDFYLSLASHSKKAKRLDLALLHALSWPTKVLHLIVQRPYAIHVSRRDKSSKRQRRRSHPKKLCTKAVFQRQEAGTMGNAPVSPKSSRVCLWDNLFRRSFIRPFPTYYTRAPSHSSSHICYSIRPQGIPFHLSILTFK
jgi:hypothetical protein